MLVGRGRHLWKQCDMGRVVEMAWPCHITPRRSMVNFYEIFSKEKREEGRKRLREELKRGHFDDFKQLRDTGGKLFQGSASLTPTSVSERFPSVVVSTSDGQEGVLRTEGKGAVLVCAACRDGAQPMIDRWATAFDDALCDKDGVGIVELSIVDSKIMSLWPFRRMLYAQQSGFDGKYKMDDAQSVFLFSGKEGYQNLLGMMDNRLTGYVFLLDRDGRIRWRGCGFPTEEEVRWLVSGAEALLRKGT